MAGQYHVTVCESGPHAALRMTRPVRHDQFGTDLSYGIHELEDLIHDSGLTACGPASTTMNDQVFDSGTEIMEFAVPLELGPRLGPSRRGEVVLMPGSLVARTVHRGGYDGLAPAYNALREWLRDSGFRPIGPPTQVYLIGPDEATDPQLLLTEIRIPVAAIRTLEVRVDASYDRALATAHSVLQRNGFRILGTTDLGAEVLRPDQEQPAGPTLMSIWHPGSARRLMDVDPAAALLVSTTVSIRPDDLGGTRVATSWQSTGIAESPHPEVTAVTEELHRLLTVVLADIAAA